MISYSIHILGQFLKFYGLLMFVPVICSLIYGEDDIFSFIFPASITTLSGIGLELYKKQSGEVEEIDRRTGFLIVSICWIGACLFGSLPYLFYGVFQNPADAFFESVSGFTTTGATVISNPEILPKGMLFWRNFTQWLGGMGIILLAIAILPKLSIGGMQLMVHEVSEHKTDKITPKIAETAKKLWAVYIFLSVMLVLLLFLSGMPFFDSILHSFTTIATGGYSPRAESVGSYDLVYADIIITCFMFIGGMNFILIFTALRGKFRNVWDNSEFRFYLFLNLGAILLLSVLLTGVNYNNFFDSLRYASFQVISISTGTGYSTADYNLWPVSTQFVLLILMFVGASSGSTTGAIKAIRVLVILKAGYREIKSLLHPRAIFPVRVDNNAVDENILSSITSFVILYIFTAFLSVLVLLQLEDIDIITAFSAAVASIGTVGPGLGQVGPMENYSFFKSGTKVFLSVLMLVGRLELYAMLILLTPFFWRK